MELKIKNIRIYWYLLDRILKNENLVLFRGRDSETNLISSLLVVAYQNLKQSNWRDIKKTKQIVEQLGKGKTTVRTITQQVYDLVIKTKWRFKLKTITQTVNFMLNYLMVLIDKNKNIF